MSRFTVKAIRAFCATLFLVALGAGVAAGTETAATAGGGRATTNDVWCC